MIFPAKMQATKVFTQISTLTVIRVFNQINLAQETPHIYTPNIFFPSPNKGTFLQLNSLLFLFIYLFLKRTAGLAMQTVYTER